MSRDTSPPMGLLIVALSVLILSANAVANRLESDGKLLRGKHIRIIAATEPPSFIFIRDPHNSTVVGYGGVGFEILELLATSMGFTYSIDEITKEGYENGVPEAMIGRLVTGEYDMMVNPLLNSHERATKIFATVFIGTTGTNIVQPMPRLETRIFAVIKPLQPLVWWLLGISFLAIAATRTILIILTSMIYWKDQSNNRSKLEIFNDNLIFTFLILMGQGSRWGPWQPSQRIICATWALIAVVLMYTLKGTLVSSLSVPKYEPVVNTLDDLAKSDSLKIIAYKGSVLYNSLMEAKSGAYARLGASLREHPNHVFGNLRETMPLLRSRCCALSVELPAALYYVESTKMADRCTLTIGKELDIQQAHFSLFLRKNYPYAETINKQIQRAKEAGLLDKLIEKWLPLEKTARCINRRIDQQELPLSLYDLSSAFIILGAGISVTSFMFIIELVRNVYRKKRTLSIRPPNPEIENEL